MTEYRISIIVEGQDRASGPLGAAGGALGRIGEIAGGIIGAQVLQSIATGIMDIGSRAIQATADFQSMQVGLESLIAREISLGKASADVYAGLQNVAAGGITIAEAMPVASGKAAELMKVLQDIAILSPFESTTVQETFKMAMAFGYTSDEATIFTQAMLDMAAGVGANNEMLGRMSYNFAQIRMQGKVTAMDIRQLAMAGFDLTSMLKYTGQQMGINIQNHEDFNKALESGKITWEDFTRSFQKYSKENFGGASERMSRTLNGLKSTFKDVFNLSMPAILGPAAEVFTGFANNVLDSFLKIRESGALEEFGEKLGMKVGTALSKIEGFVDVIKRIPKIFENEGFSFGVGWLAAHLGIDYETVGKIIEFSESIETGIGKLKDSIEIGLGNLKAFWDENGETIKGAFGDIGKAFEDLFTGLFGDGEIDPEQILAGIGQAFEDGTGWIKDNGPQIASSIQTVADAIANMGDWIVENKDQILGFLVGFGGTLLVINGATAVPGIIAAVGAAMSGALAKIAVLAGPVGLVALALGTIMSLLVGYGEKILGADAANATFFEKLEVGFWGVLATASNTVWMMGEIITTVWGRIRDNAIAIFEEVKRIVVTAFENARASVAEKVEAVRSVVADKIGKVKTVFDNVKSSIEGLISRLADLLRDLANAVIPDWLQRHSPSPIEMAFGNWLMYAKGLAIELPRVQTSLNMPTPAILGGGSSTGRVYQDNRQYNLGVNTSNGADVVTRSFAVMEVLANAS